LRPAYSTTKIMQELLWLEHLTRYLADYCDSASRFAFAQALSLATAFIGGPPCVPQAQGPSVLASVMQKQDFVFRQAQT
jgi:hypothetical protein